MAKASRLRLRFATAGFLAEMRKQFASARPGEDCPVKNLEDYSSEQRSAIMAGVEKALQYGSDDSDAIFARWVEIQNERENTPFGD